MNTYTSKGPLGLSCRAGVSDGGSNPLGSTIKSTFVRLLNLRSLGYWRSLYSLGETRSPRNHCFLNSKRRSKRVSPKLMKILFDQGTPAPLRHTLLDHTLSTACEIVDMAIKFP